MNYLIPCAGLGKRFNSSVPKPLIDVNGKYMLELVIENLHQDDDRFLCCILKEHEEKFGISKKIKSRCCADVDFVIIDKLTDGPARTSYLAKDLVNTDDELIITNCDQIILDFDINLFKMYAAKHKYDGLLGTFFSRSPKNSFVKLGDNGMVTEVKEKIVLSEFASNGFHYWAKASSFFQSCEEMFAKNDKTLNEFYVAPSFNYLINSGKKIGHFFFNWHFPIGTPEDLQTFLKFS